MIFPRFVFKNGGDIQRAGGTYSMELVDSKDKHDAMLAGGWFTGLLEAITPKEVAIDAPPTREELEAKADELGIKYDGRIGDKKLAGLIDTAMGV